ncbi:U7 snRNA-associated Sm-like protein LSm11 [Hyperolius riggenbachi]|uniref:U7 snRNA-associated Sm-like protein LSm11 n=1 Tax=Hyperolius riggenbachi TaxID=752182 RepID=UPI0035A37855
MERGGRREAQARQAAASGDSGTVSEDEVPGGCLDVSSEAFDPLRALYCPRTPIPFPEVRCFNNLAEYESFLRGGGRGRARGQRAAKKGKKPAPDPERVERLKKLMVVKPEDEDEAKQPRRRRREPKNVLTRMPKLADGPLGMLYRCVQERLKVNVHIRTFKGLRGVCSGFLAAFDKCWNLAMVDVDETYRKPVLGKAFYNEPQLTLTRLFDRLKLQDSESAPSTETQSAAVTKPIAPAPPQRSAGRRSSSRDPRRSVRSRDKRSPDPVQGRSGTTGDKSKERTRKQKIDYQKVFTRHMKQVFIRGENILLIHLPE